MRKIILSCILLILLSASLLVDFLIKDTVSTNSTLHFDTGDISWMLVATSLVLLMTPGLGFFYGGMVGKKNVISTMLQSFMAMVIVTLLWVVIGFGLSFGGFAGATYD